MCKRIGILGGTFDPFHKGHFMLAKTAYQQFELDEVWIMPNGNPPHKRNIEQTDFEIRCEMIRRSIKEAPYMVLCDYEGSEDSYHFWAEEHVSAEPSVSPSQTSEAQEAPVQANDSQLPNAPTTDIPSVNEPESAVITTVSDEPPKKKKRIQNRLSM